MITHRTILCVGVLFQYYTLFSIAQESRETAVVPTTDSTTFSPQIQSLGTRSSVDIRVLPSSNYQTEISVAMQSKQPEQSSNRGEYKTPGAGCIQSRLLLLDKRRNFLVGE